GLMTGISAAAVARSRTLGEARWSPAGTRLAWLDAFGGRVDLVVAPADGHGPDLVITAAVPVTSLGAYGGGGYSWVDDDTLIYAAADGRLLALAATGGPVKVLSRDGRAAAPAVSPDGRRIAFVVERDDSCDIAVVDIDGTTWPRRVSYADYAWDPTWSADGGTLAWHEWDLPNMPWDGSRIVAVAIDDADAAPVLIAGGDDVAVGQPRFAPTGDALAFVAELDSWMNVWTVANVGDAPTCVLPEQHEHADPSWGPGQRSFAWSPDASAIALTRNEEGFGRLVVVPLSSEAAHDRSATDVSKGWHTGLDWGSAGIVCIRSGGRTAPQLAVVDPATGKRDVRRRGAPAELDAHDLPEPTPITWLAADGETVHGLLWLPPANETEAAPPLLVDVHGGPTDQSTVDWKPRIRWFVSRGWAVLSPNYRGSSGYGRAYRHALDQAWGDVDVTDTVAGLRALANDERVDESRAAVIGGSAGGFTALLVAAHSPPVVRAVVSLFGVTDLFDLAATTHRFESRYLDRLVGTLPEHADRYEARSPVTRAHDIAIPVLVLQGADDKVVPPAQAQLFVDSMRAAGGTVEQHVYEGEGHGFSKEATIVDSYERIDAFLTRWVVQR
ncbi:MAG TPA: S9 family peptidase, partial [Acidimicrobiia bacterium]|nr:S9 family peptidase [Acidimicrobiia bacterium]